MDFEQLNNTIKTIWITIKQIVLLCLLANGVLAKVII